MIDLVDFFEGLDWTFKREFSINNPCFNGACNVSLSEENEYHIEDTRCTDYTKKNVFYIYIGHLIIKYSGKYILRYLLEKANESIAEVENNLQNFDLSEEDKEKILSIAKQVKEDLPKLKIFETSTELIDLERKEFLESQNK